MKETIRSFAGAVAVLALLGCESSTGVDDTGLPDNAKVTFFVIAEYANPAFAVQVNGDTRGSITSQYTGPLSCTGLIEAGSSRAFPISAFVGQSYTIRAIHPDGSWWQWENVEVTEETWIESACYYFGVPAPPY
ncbi:MAG TPA: hypothetical protein VMN78_07865 [Longimicrobiales bacterium]|nr:hypothetical protein [Longimicrobiales bacterium]